MLKIPRQDFSELDHLSICDRHRVAARYSNELVPMAGLVPAIHGTDIEFVLIDLASDLESMTDEMATGRLGIEIITKAAALVLLMQHLFRNAAAPTIVH